MSRTTGILTFHHAQNYGAVLQAFALQRSIINLGHECRIVNYTSRLHGNAEKLFRLGFSRNAARQNLRTLANLFDHIRSRRRFSEFRNRNLALSKETYITRGDLVISREMYDAYICGSDQVWNPSLLEEGDCWPYFLDFVTDKHKVSYAPSFGSIKNFPACQDKVSSLLKRFDFLSGREEAGCHIINSYSGRRAVHALDPTLLLEGIELNRISIKPKYQSRYILLYPMAKPGELCKISQSLRNRLKIPLIAILPIYHSPRAFSFADKIVYDAGPAEFLGWIQAATCVCSNSYHGISLSIAFQKNFIATADSALNIRSQNLLKRLGLQARQVLEPIAPQHCAVWDCDINYVPVLDRLYSARKESLEYLKSAIQ